MSAAVERRHWHFTGSVQGVGFRYRAQYAAQLLDLTGWVENNWDGTVDLEAQGSAAQLDRLVPTITGTSHWIHIETFTCKSIPPDPAERSFRVRCCLNFGGREPPLTGFRRSSPPGELDAKRPEGRFPAARLKICRERHLHHPA